MPLKELKMSKTELKNLSNKFEFLSTPACRQAGNSKQNRILKFKI